MSSNIRIQRICHYCQKEFEAKKTTTKTCSDSCAKMLYKQKQKAIKIDTSNKETETIKAKPIEDLKAKEFLSVREVAKILGCSKQTIYTLVNSGQINGVNIKIKKTIIPRYEVDKLFKKAQ